MLTWFLGGACAFLLLIIIGLLVAINSITGLIGGGVQAWLDAWSKR